MRKKRASRLGQQDAAHPTRSRAQFPPARKVFGLGAKSDSKCQTVRDGTLQRKAFSLSGRKRWQSRLARQREVDPSRMALKPARSPGMRRPLSRGIHNRSRKRLAATNASVSSLPSVSIAAGSSVESGGHFGGGTIWQPSVESLEGLQGPFGTDDFRPARGSGGWAGHTERQPATPHLAPALPASRPTKTPRARGAAEMGGGAGVSADDRPRLVAEPGFQGSVTSIFGHGLGLESLFEEGGEGGEGGGGDGGPGAASGGFRTGARHWATSPVMAGKRPVGRLAYGKADAVHHELGRGSALSAGSTRYATAVAADGKYARDAIARARAIIGLRADSLGIIDSVSDASVARDSVVGHHSPQGRIAPGARPATAGAGGTFARNSAGRPAERFAGRSSTSPVGQPGGQLRQGAAAMDGRRKLLRPVSVAAMRAPEGRFLDAQPDPDAFLRTALSPLQRPATAAASRRQALQRQQPQLSGTWRSAAPRHGQSAGSLTARTSNSAATRAAQVDDEEDELAVSRFVAAAMRRKAAGRIHAWVRRMVARRRWRKVANRRFELIARPIFKAWSQHTFMRRFLIGWRARKVFARWKFFYLERKATYRMILNIGMSETLDRAREARRTAARQQNQLLGGATGGLDDPEHGQLATRAEGALGSASAITIDSEAVRLRLASRLLLAASADEWFNEPLGEVQGRRRGALAALPVRPGRRGSVAASFGLRPPWWTPGRKQLVDIVLQLGKLNVGDSGTNHGRESDAVGRQLGLSTKLSPRQRDAGASSVAVERTSADADSRTGQRLLGALANAVSQESLESRRMRLEATRRRQWVTVKLHAAALRVARAPSELLSAAAHIYAGDEAQVDRTGSSDLFGDEEGDINEDEDLIDGQDKDKMEDDEEGHTDGDAEDQVAKAGGYLLLEAKQSQRAHMAAKPEDSDLHPLALGLGPPPCVRAAGIAVTCAEAAVRHATGGAYGLFSLPRKAGGQVIPPAATHALYDLLESASSQACRRLGARVRRPMQMKNSARPRPDSHLDDIVAKVPTPHTPVLLRRSLAQVATHLKKRFMLAMKLEVADRRSVRAKGVAALRAAFGGIMKQRNLVFTGLVATRRDQAAAATAKEGKPEGTADAAAAAAISKGEPALMPDGRLLWPSQLKSLCFELWMRWTVAKRETRLGRPVPTFRERRRLPEWDEYLRQSRLQAAARVEAQATERGQLLQAVFDRWSVGFLEDSRRARSKDKFAQQLARRVRMRRVLVAWKVAFASGEMSRQVQD